MSATPSVIDAHGLGDLVKPFSARNVVLSTLLGTYPPRLAGGLLVAFAERFGIAPGTTRVALSRLVDRGDLINEDGTYALAESQLERQRRQDQSRQRTTTTWDGTWEQAIVVSTGRSANDRARLRTALDTMRLGELREGVWLRPANLSPERSARLREEIADQVHWFRLAPLPNEDGAELVGHLFDLTGWEANANRLIAAASDALVRAEAADSETNDQAMVDGFLVAAALWRHRVYDPSLPEPLQPPGWPVAKLAQADQALHQGLQQHLRSFFRQAKEQLPN